jgi:hypothetical protein
MTGDFSKSYLSLMGIGELGGEDTIKYSGKCSYAEGGSAKDSDVIKLLNPPLQFPTPSTATRAFPGMPVHPTDMGGMELTPAEYYLLILNLDMGGQFFFRENLDSATGYTAPAGGI